MKVTLTEAVVLHLKISAAMFGCTDPHLFHKLLIKHQRAVEQKSALTGWTPDLVALNDYIQTLIDYYLMLGPLVAEKWNEDFSKYFEMLDYNEVESNFTTWFDDKTIGDMVAGLDLRRS